jgi:hypothetical protein
MVAQPHRRWEVYVRGTKIGEVYGVTERAACVRAVLRFNISREDQEDLEVRRLRERSTLLRAIEVGIRAKGRQAC